MHNVIIQIHYAKMAKYNLERVEIEVGIDVISDSYVVRRNRYGG